MAIDPALKSTSTIESRLAEQARPQTRWQGRLLIGVRYLLMIMAAIFFITPFVWMFLASLKPEVEIFQYIYPLNWKTFVPQTWTLENFDGLMKMQPYPFTHYMANSVFVAVSVTISSLVVNTMA